MPCMICKHTLKRIGVSDNTGDPLLWCGRCGTFSIRDDGDDIHGQRYVEAPRIVQHARRVVAWPENGIPPNELESLRESVWGTDGTEI